jgi:ketosteroid isomerase-like protein
VTRENIETARASLETWNAGNMDAFSELLDPDVILRNPEGWPEPGPHVGRDAVVRQFQEARDLWDSDVLEAASEFIEIADRVLVRTIWRGVRHGVDSNLEFTIVFTVRKGKIFGFEYFWDHAEALEVMGITAPRDDLPLEAADIARRAHEVFNSGDFERFVELWHPDCEYRPALEGGVQGGGGVYRGQDGIRRWWRGMEEAWREWSTEIHEIRDLDISGRLSSVTFVLRDDIPASRSSRRSRKSSRPEPGRSHPHRTTLIRTPRSKPLAGVIRKVWSSPTVASRETQKLSRGGLS